MASPGTGLWRYEEVLWVAQPQVVMMSAIGPSSLFHEAT